MTTAGASLMPDSASRMAEIRGRNRIRRSTENTAAASVDDTIAPIRTAERQSPNTGRATTRDDANADQDPDRCQGRAHPEHGTDVRQPTGETTLREDHDERDESQLTFDLDAVSGDRRPDADDQADPQIQQQTRQTDPIRQPHRQQGDQQQTGPQEQGGRKREHVASEQPSSHRDEDLREADHREQQPEPGTRGGPAVGGVREHCCTQHERRGHQDAGRSLEDA